MTKSNHSANYALMGLEFTQHHHDKKARTGTLVTAHGAIRTPAFMPVGTAATVKGLTPEMVADTGADVLLGNTYHLMLRPTAERIERLGGLHKFMQWNKPILTDSGGFQVMSLGDLRKITEEGVEFKSHIDGSKHMLSPERAMDIQYKLDSNITMVFDECTSYPATYDEAMRSMQRSMRWEQRSKNAFIDRRGYGLFGIQQGSMFEDLREESSIAMREIGFDGYAIGGLAVGEGQEVMFSVLDVCADMLPADKPRYLMGVGKPTDIIGAVQRGVDMFDCVIPTRSGRFARAYTTYGEINIRNAHYADDPTPLDAVVPCRASQFSRAYLHHLFKADEMLGAIALSWHNIAYYQYLMQHIRDAIAAKTLDDLGESVRAAYLTKKTS
jgi:queuine tRNA-ribosyltransferase